MFTFQIKKIKGKYTVIRKWDKDVFPVNPVKGIDVQ